MIVLIVDFRYASAPIVLLYEKGDAVRIEPRPPSPSTCRLCARSSRTLFWPRASGDGTWMQGVLSESRALCRLSINSRAGSNSGSQQQQYEELVDNSWRWPTSTASSAPDAVLRVPGWGPIECGLVRDLFSLCTQQLQWFAADELSFSWLCHEYCCCGTCYTSINNIGVVVLHVSYQVYSRWDLKLCLQPLALIILKLGMIKVAVSNWSSKKSVMELLRFESRNIYVFFCLLWKGPIFERQKNLHNKGPNWLIDFGIDWLVDW